jgi:hypothetical protein
MEDRAHWRLLALVAPLPAVNNGPYIALSLAGVRKGSEHSAIFFYKQCLKNKKSLTSAQQER